METGHLVDRKVQRLQRKHYEMERQILANERENSGSRWGQTRETNQTWTKKRWQGRRLLTHGSCSGIECTQKRRRLLPLLLLLMRGNIVDRSTARRRNSQWNGHGYRLLDRCRTAGWRWRCSLRFRCRISVKDETKRIEAITFQTMKSIPSRSFLVTVTGIGCQRWRLLSGHDRIEKRIVHQMAAHTWTGAARRRYACR